jgi:glyoxylase-like metal-dependent hydrolase (beta-lactamase superfamily II)
MESPSLTPRLELRTRPVGSMQMNTYVLVCPETRQSALVDPGAEPSVLLELVMESSPALILLTHSHYDHVNALTEMRTRLKVPVLAHPGPHTKGVTINAERWLNDGDIVQLGNHTLRAYHTPGHSPDMLSFAIQNDPRILVGDTLFDGGPGRTRTPEDFQTTLHTLRTVVLNWPNDTVCYPGHGPVFRLRDQRPAIEAFLRKDHGDFSGNATWDM